MDAEVIEPMRQDSGALVFAWATEPWQFLVLMAVALAAGWMSWRWYGPRVPGWQGTVAAAARVLAVVSCILLAAGPSWQTTTREQSVGQLLVAVDRSASMARTDYVPVVSDATNAGSSALTDSATPLPRIHAAYQVQQQLVADQRNAEMRLDWFSLGDSFARIENIDDSTTWLNPAGAISALGEQTADILAQRSPEAVAIISDGRVTDGRSLAAVAEMYRVRGVPVYILGLGGQQVDPDLQIEDTILPPSIARGERQPLTVRLAGLALGPEARDVVIDVHKGADSSSPAISTQTVTLDAVAAEDALPRLVAEARLPIVLDEVGDGKLFIHARAGDFHATRTVQVSVHERRLHVLLLAHRPRFEMRYMREALRRDPAVDIHSYLADGGWRRWGGAEFGPRKYLLMLKKFVITMPLLSVTLAVMRY